MKSRKEIQRDYYLRNKEAVYAYCKQWRAMRRKERALVQSYLPAATHKYCRTCCEILGASCFNKNVYKKDGLNTYCRACSNKRLKEWNAKNDKMKGYAKTWRVNNPDKVRARKTERKLLERKLAYAGWADRKAIALIYADASLLTKQTGIQHDVDHVIPLKHPRVCGLHVETNLQILTRGENAKNITDFWRRGNGSVRQSG